MDKHIDVRVTNAEEVFEQTNNPADEGQASIAATNAAQCSESLMDQITRVNDNLAAIAPATSSVAQKRRHSNAPTLDGRITKAEKRSSRRPAKTWLQRSLMENTEAIPIANLDGLNLNVSARNAASFPQSHQGADAEPASRQVDTIGQSRDDKQSLTLGPCIQDGHSTTDVVDENTQAKTLPPERTSIVERPLITETPFAQAFRILSTKYYSRPKKPIIKSELLEVINLGDSFLVEDPVAFLRRLQDDLMRDGL